MSLTPTTTQLSCLVAAVCLLSGAAVQADVALPEQLDGGASRSVAISQPRRALKDCTFTTSASFAGTYSVVDEAGEPKPDTKLCTCIKQARNGIKYDSCGSDAYAAATWTTSMAPYGQKGDARGNGGYTVTCNGTVSDTTGDDCFDGTTTATTGAYYTSLDCQLSKTTTDCTKCRLVYVRYKWITIPTYKCP